MAFRLIPKDRKFFDDFVALADRIVSGATSGGAFLVVKPSITKPADLKGKRIATPSLGNTQDVAARAYLRSKGLRTDAAGGGDVSLLPQTNATTLDSFKQGLVDGAWVPEPWASAAFGCQRIDEWLYDRGPGNLVAVVRFRGGLVQSIRYGRSPE